MTAGILDFTIEQGATFSRIITWKDENDTPINLTGYTARMQIREHLASAGTLAELTTANGGIIINAALGKLTLTLSATATDALTPSRAVYDLEVESSGGVVTRLLQGNILIERSVTR